MTLPVNHNNTLSSSPQRSSTNSAGVGKPADDRSDAKAHPRGSNSQISSYFFQNGQLSAALSYNEKALKVGPTPEDLNRHSGILVELSRFEEALSFADSALKLRYPYPEALFNKSQSLMGLGNSEKAISMMENVSFLVPGNPIILHALALQRLRVGDLCKRTWEHFDHRLLLDGRHSSISGLGIWRGECIATKTLLVHGEEGLGDTIQFARYVPLVAPLAKRVVLAVQKPLVRLLQGLPGVGEVVAIGEPLPAFDCICPILSLPYIFGTTLQIIPPPCPPVLDRPRTSVTKGPLRVGLVWSGNPNLKNDQQRSIDPDSFAVLEGISNVRFYSLQKHEVGHRILPRTLQSVDLLRDVVDFRDTALKIADLDLVISVDTAVAHLAATMGKQVWLLSRYNGCWRWLRDRTDSPWYPTITIYRQETAGEWRRTVEQVRRDLLTAAHRHDVDQSD